VSESNLYAAHGQWATRPADERFWTLDGARAACSVTRHRRGTRTRLRHRVTRRHRADNLALTLDGGRGNRLATFTNWGFGQVARMAGAPASTCENFPCTSRPSASKRVWTSTSPDATR